MQAQAHAQSASPSDLHRRTCHFTGRVQGVGFRYTVHNLAMPHNVRGYVRNLPDGRVELVMEGPDQDMDHLLDAIRQKMSHFIRRVDTQVEPPTNAFSGFSIKH
jgi:acylphosphatase